MNQYDEQVVFEIVDFFMVLLVKKINWRTEGMTVEYLPSKTEVKVQTPAPSKKE
jgi:hypothetical protein